MFIKLTAVLEKYASWESSKSLLLMQGKFDHLNWSIELPNEIRIGVNAFGKIFQYYLKTNTPSGFYQGYSSLLADIALINNDKKTEAEILKQRNITQGHALDLRTLRLVLRKEKLAEKQESFIMTTMLEDLYGKEFAKAVKEIFLVAKSR